MNKEISERQPENGIKGNITLNWWNRIAYGCGDTACNIVCGMINALLTLFYTDYAGIPIATVGLVMLISRIFDGSSDIIMGVIVSKTKSKWGKSRPWLLWMSVPYVICAIAMFTVPQTNSTIQFWYIFVTYNLCTTICYTAINVPYGTLSTMMTRSSHERDLLSIVRMSMAPVGRLIAVTFTMPVVKLFGDTQSAWVKAMMMWCAIAFVMLLICFKNCEEHVQIEAPKKAPKTSFRANVKALLGNPYFWATLILWTITCVHQTLVGTVLPYYCKYIFGNDSWMYSTLYMAEAITLIVGALICPMLLKHMGKRDLSLAGCILAVVSQLLFFLMPYSYPAALITTILRALGEAPLTAVVFGMMGDVIEYGQWKSHIRQESLVFGGGSLGFKLGVGLTSALISSLLNMSGYISSSTGGAVQPESAKQMIMAIYKYGTTAIWLIAVVVLIFYKLDKLYPKIMKELEERELRGEM
ncbi:MAG: MFS transporter [Dorea sp.]